MEFEPEILNGAGGSSIGRLFSLEKCTFQTDEQSVQPNDTAISEWAQILDFNGRRYTQLDCFAPSDFRLVRRMFFASS
jgi:hypothetical protein